jgi:DNA-binding transcriptional regulator YhcF (GntR family)
MISSQEKTIFGKLAYQICEEILEGKYHSEDRIPSVRDLAETFEVNYNTILRAMELLQREEIVYQKRGIGYFVSDRRQPKDTVCVYIFILPETRRSYDPTKFTEQQIHDFADITCIADTWGNGSERRAALERLKAVFTNASRPTTDKATEANTAIVINDRLTYTSAKDFRSPTAANHYRELLKARERLSTLEAELQKSRDRYAGADENGRSLLRDIILHNEEQSLTLRNNIHTLEKQIRNEENNNLK